MEEGCAPYTMAIRLETAQWRLSSWEPARP